MDTKSPWTNKAVRVDTASEDLTRLPARPVEEEQQDGSSLASGNVEVDATTTAAVRTQSSSEPTLNASHVEWCRQRYRSYDSADNSYNAYSGARRPCVSPYLEGPSQAGDVHTVSASTDAPSLIATAQAGELTQSVVNDEHIRSCFDRYRSYRPEDNSYQPYGSGPRQQCQ
jgi:hypothetical protein